ncbi:MAG: DUF429 domain-containing protein [Planctomycetota bacterium]
MVNATKSRHLNVPTFQTVFGVDFSGAAESGRNAWLAELTSPQPLDPENGDAKLQLTALAPLESLTGSPARADVNAFLVRRIRESEASFWGFDFPFGLPIELALGDWEHQLDLVTAYDGNAKDFGRMLVETTEHRLGTKHVRRTTDKETQTPFDCYHYRIIYQTFHGMRDVLAPIRNGDAVCVLPFQYEKLSGQKPDTVVVEACPSSTLKRLGLPHQNYKQSGNKPPEENHKRTRRAILKTLTRFVEISPHRRRIIMNNPGGDALDAVLAGVGSWQGLTATPHRDVANDARYPLEGRVYC